MEIETKFSLNEKVFTLYDNNVEESKVERIELEVSDLIEAGNFGSIEKYNIEYTYYLRDLRDNTRKEDNLLVVSDEKLMFRTKQELLNSL